MARGNSLSEQERLDRALVSAALDLGRPRSAEEEARSLGVLKDLLDKGADPNARDVFGATPIHWIARGSSLAMGRLLLEAGADLDAKDNTGSEALHKALMAHEDGMLAWLLEAGANPNPEPDRGGHRPLDFAAASRHAKGCEILIKAGARGLPNAKGQTALHQAAGYATERILRLLVSEGGCDLDALDEDGKTALELVDRHYGCHDRDGKLAFLKSPEARAMNVTGQVRELEEATSDSGPRAVKAKARL